MTKLVLTICSITCDQKVIDYHWLEPLSLGHTYHSLKNSTVIAITHCTCQYCLLLVHGRCNRTVIAGVRYWCLSIHIGRIHDASTDVLMFWRFPRNSETPRKVELHNSPRVMMRFAMQFQYQYWSINYYLISVFSIAVSKAKASDQNS